LGLTVSPSSANKLAFDQQPTTTTAGATITPSPTVIVQDQYGNTVSGNSSTVNISGTTFTGGSTLSVAASSGVATFSNLKPTTAGGSITLTAADGALTGATSSAFTVNQATSTTISSVTLSQTISYGTSSVTLTGLVSAVGPVYPANGETVSVTINSLTTNATVSGGAGGFFVSFPTATIPASPTPYTITYSYAGNANLAAAPDDTSTALTVNKANPVLSVTNSPVTYNGSPQEAGVASSAAGTVSNVKYNGSSTAPTAAATYAVTADFTPDDTANYNTPTDASAGSFVIQKATPTATLVVNNSPVTYDGNPHSATVGISASSVSGSVSSILTGGAASQTAAGSYAVTATFVPDDAANYNSLPGLSAGNFVINQATTSVSVSSSQNPSGYQTSVSFTATFPANATGSVIFKTNGVVLSTNSISSGSAASDGTSSLPRGSNAITAEYSGDGNYIGSTNDLTGGQIVTNHPPIANNSTYSRAVGISYKVDVATLLS